MLCSRRVFVSRFLLSLPLWIAASACRKGSREHKEASPPVVLGKLAQFQAGMNERSVYRVAVLVETAEKEKRLAAVSTVCTHQTCLLEIGQDGFKCPCHGSKFAPDGSVILGPAKKQLPWYGLSISGTGEVLLHLDWQVEPAWRLAIPV